MRCLQSITLWTTVRRDSGEGRVESGPTGKLVHRSRGGRSKTRVRFPLAPLMQARLTATLASPARFLLCRQMRSPVSLVT